MKKGIRRVTMALFCVYLLICGVFAKELVPVGSVIGLELQDRQVVVAGFDEKQGAAAKAAGLCNGDVIQKIDNVAITCAEDVRKALQKSDGTVCLEISRKGKVNRVQMMPQITKDGPRLGVYLRQGVSGIGTVTWYDPETKQFGTLGHGVNDSSGNLLPMARGNIYQAKVMAVKKGKIGEPGQLYGTITSQTPIGTLTGNTQQGVFGVSTNGWEGQTVSVAKSSEVKAGEAVIRSTISGDTVREYSVEILKIYPKTRNNGRNLLIKVTDPELLATTGGIVQGMSGSPIIQNGKLIGAVTHVLVNDPTTGYGIFIENMLDAAA
ncbi:MAG: SpoIVB peptidase [Ruminococcaceae bacterium]|nr:SpoIVB peptidase [Oscillospiraceae bacterium]